MLLRISDSIALSTYSQEVYICISEILCKFLDFQKDETNWRDGIAEIVKTQDSNFIASSGTPWGLISSHCKFCSMFKDNYSVEIGFTSCKFPQQSSRADLSARYECHFFQLHTKRMEFQILSVQRFYNRELMTQTHVMRWLYIVFSYTQSL
jgi:hypothetical protein